MKNYIKHALAVAGVIGIASSSAMAASDCAAAAATCSGTSDVSLVVNALYRITGVGDIDFGTYDGASNITVGDDMCIYTNNFAATYQVTVSDGDSDNDTVFDIADTNSNELVFTAQWNDVAGTTGQVALTEAAALAAQGGANKTSLNCDDHASDNAHLDLTITNATMNGAIAGTYTETLTILIEPTA